MRHPLTFSALAVLVASVAAPLQAAEPAKPDPFIIRFLGKDPTTGKASACFIRTYDNAHLAAHPQQKVTAMMLLVRGEFDKESKTVDYSFSLGLKLRGKNARFQSAG